MNILPGRLARQIFRRILVVYACITVAITLLQMAAEFFDTRALIHQELLRIERIFTPPLAGALWELNHSQMEAIQKGIMDFPSVSVMTVEDAFGHRTRLPDDAFSPNIIIAHEFKLFYSFAGETKFLATVKLETGKDVVIDRLALRYQLHFLAALVKSAVLTLLFSLVFRRSLGKPLEHLIATAGAVSISSLDRSRVDLGQTKENELTDLETTFNTMLRTLDSERREHESELLRINSALEEQVRERTSELESANSALRSLASTDPLTKVANRRSFSERTVSEMERSRRNGRPLSLLMLDLDFFKKVNDTWGHAGGDAVLCDFARTTESVVRTTDIVARLGGEEFAVLLPDTGIEGAEILARRLLDSVRARSVAYNGGEIVYTVSIGLAAFGGAEETYDSLLDRADSGLYLAKRNGRDRMETVL